MINNLKLILKRCIYWSSSLVFFPVFLSGSSSWYDQKLQGWYYFEDLERKEEEATQITPEDAETLLDAQKKHLHQLLSLALIQPTSENVEKYIREQKQLLNQSNRFAETWGKVLLQHPLLGDFLATPTTNYGVLAMKELELKKKKTILEHLSTQYFLLFFFRGNDPLAEAVAEVVKLFASTNGWKYKAVSLDGKGIPSLAVFEPDQGLSTKVGAQTSPSLYIVDPTHNWVFPVGAGLVSVSEIEQNIITQLEVINDE